MGASPLSKEAHWHCRLSFPLIQKVISLAYQSTGKLLRGTHLHSKWDYDSFKIGVEIQTSRTMSPIKSQFKDLCPFPTSVTGIGSSSLTVKGIGTFCFHVNDNTGRRHSITIPNSLFVPGLTYTLLCPQHWAQKAGPGTRMESDGETCRLVWGNNKFSKMVSFDTTTNVLTFFSASGVKQYIAH